MADGGKLVENGMLEISLHTMGGNRFHLALLTSATVKDLAHQVRTQTHVPIATQNLVWNGELLTDPSLVLAQVFGDDVQPVELLLVQRQLTLREQKELHEQLLRAVAGRRSETVRELLKEGAHVNPEHVNKSDCLEHVKQEHEAPDTDEATTVSEESSGEDINMATEDLPHGISPLMMAIATGDKDLASELRERGAREPDMTPLNPDLATAFRSGDLVDAVRQIAAGACVNTPLRRGEGVQCTSSGTPLHACCAMHRQPGAYALAELLVGMKADLSIGDSEGDTPLAHARYFKANELFELLEGHGATIEGPFYRMLGRR
mmetsp:Transcript_27297/g.49416  ORF Transcript_27297/g.49416 Transcript_27297/m.49416 type:complete len:319 (+) Transcript_27297:84-1040(+)|eukprot:CAMPEP_0197657018 /NCGR_PEP_ID=MMETSP1338-20131121/44376_1 /TAXON_ID=43686 ORGANISM="Pelagodinium beii, Strain RCC1491" /NCGR_SAMPLE_ID=MMETSP1338 /ASSEMBLY_ACC=CAM_ASM_000754 /LENGTH=318 /DNA_ID=CAMNT_0043233301 /DNA_START=79 /DNA_END=1035 /DNA_ORIENTATION=+